MTVFFINYRQNDSDVTPHSAIST